MIGVGLVTAGCGSDGAGASDVDAGAEVDAGGDTAPDGSDLDAGSSDVGGVDAGGTDADASADDTSTDAATDVAEDAASDGSADVLSDVPDDGTADVDAGADADASTDAGGDAGSDVDIDAGGDAGPDAGDDAGLDADLDTGGDDSGGSDPGGLCAEVTRTPLPPRGEGTNPGAASPWGTGQSSNITLGALEDPSVVERSTGPVVNTAEDLDAFTYDIWIPADYDGSEPYGLIAWINSGNNGGGPNGSWQAELAAQNLIFIAPDGAGNPITVDIRMGRAYLGTLRAMELLNIDETRVFAMGASGGGRTANHLTYQYPQVYAGVMAFCGANYPREVPETYASDEPNYESWGDFYLPDRPDGTSVIDYLRPFENRFALMTEFGDFREGHMMNIYHHGLEADGFIARFIETAGGHCATNAEHIYDGLGFVQHPWFEVVGDAFDDGELGVNAGAGDGVVPVTEGVTETGGALVLDGGEVAAAALVANRVAWLDAHGLVLRLDAELADGATARISLRPWDEATHADDPASASVAPDGELGVHLEITRFGDGGTLRVLVQPASGEPVEAVYASFDDWPTATEPLDLRVDFWDRELQIDTGWHLLEPSVAAAGSMRLDDRRTLRIRWAELLGDRGWVADDWADGAVVVLTAEDGEVQFDDLQARDAAGYRCE